MIPPIPSISSDISRAVGRRRVPLNSMCSRKCETPAISSLSYREPAPMKMLILTDRVCGSELLTIRRPFGSTVLSYMSLRRPECTGRSGFARSIRALRDAEIGAANQWIGEQIASRAAEHDPPRLEHIADVDR